MRPRKINRPQILDKKNGNCIVSTSLCYEDYVNFKNMVENMNQSVGYRLRLLILKDLGRAGN